MGVLTDKPEDIGLDSLNQTERDRIDLNHEIAGRETGRIKRFLSGDSVDYYGESEKKKSEREFRTLLEILLAEDPNYAALYTRVSEKLDKARQAADQALIDINLHLEDSERKLQMMRDQAAELEDGTKVFRSENGESVYTKEGERLDNDKAQDIRFSGDEPSWEEYNADKGDHETAIRQKEEVEAFQRDVLDPAEARMKDEDNPMLTDELEDLEQILDDRVPEIIRSAYRHDVTASDIGAPSISAANDMVDKTKLDVPDMSEAFDLASVEIPDNGQTPTDGPAPTRTPR